MDAKVKKLEIKVSDEVERIIGARKAFYEDGWLKEDMYEQILLEAAEAISNAIKNLNK